MENLALDLEVNMHEVIGHASGRVSESLKVDPASVIKEYYSALEEARADLIALWFIGDPKLVELGLVPSEHREEIERTVYEMYTRQALAQLRRVPTGSQLEEDHMRNRQLIVRWLMEHTRAVDVRRRDGKTFYVLTNAAEWKAGIGRLLAEVQRIKSEGDREGAKNLVEKYGTHFDPARATKSFPVIKRWTVRPTSASSCLNSPRYAMIQEQLPTSASRTPVTWRLRC